VKENEEIEYRIQKRPRKRRDQEVGDEMGRQDLAEGVLMADTEMEVILDMDRMLKDIGTERPSGRKDYSEEDLDVLLERCEQAIGKYDLPVCVVLTGAVPHWMLVHVQHMIESAENVVQFDFVPLNSQRMTVFKGASA
jgi:hypothetical protein